MRAMGITNELSFELKGFGDPLDDESDIEEADDDGDDDDEVLDSVSDSPSLVGVGCFFPSLGLLLLLVLLLLRVGELFVLRCPSRLW